MKMENMTMENILVINNINLRQEEEKRRKKTGCRRQEEDGRR